MHGLKVMGSIKVVMYCCNCTVSEEGKANLYVLQPLHFVNMILRSVNR